MSGSKIHLKMMIGKEYDEGSRFEHAYLTDANTMLQSGNFVNIDVDNERRQLIDAGTDNLSSENETDHNATIDAPTVGIVFEKWEDVDIYYRQYGEQQGFGVVRAASRFSEKNKDQRRSITWTCECAGHRDMRRRRQRNGIIEMAQLGVDMSVVEITSKPRKSRKCDCGAMIYAKSLPEGDWFLSKVVLEHTNHSPKPSKWKDIQQYNEVLPDLERRKFAKRELHNYLANEKDAHDNVTSRETDMSYATATVEDRRLKLKDGDADAILNFFMRMHHGSQNFSHSIRHYDYGCIKDVLWVDTI